MSLFAGDLNLTKDTVWSVLMACKKRLLFVIDSYHAAVNINPKVRISQRIVLKMILNPTCLHFCFCQSITIAYYWLISLIAPVGSDC